MAKEIEIERVKVQFVNLNSYRQQLINAVELTENSLKFYIGMPIQQNLVLLKEDFDWEAHLPEENIDTEQRTEMQVLQKQKELLVIQKDAMKAAYYPTLSLMGSYNYMGQGNKFPIGKGMKDGVHWSDFSMIGLNLEIPIFSGFLNKARVSKADIELRTLEEDRSEERRVGKE